jgi:large repetitive protein
VNIVNSTFYNNLAGGAADDGGGGLMMYGGTVLVTNATFSGNSSASTGGNVRVLSGSLTLRNTIMADSAAGGNCTGPVTDGGGNLVWGDTTCPGANADPNLQPLQDNGGLTQTMALGAASAAVNAAVFANCPATDQRGLTRRSGYCDVGAYEAQPASVAAFSGTPQVAVRNYPFAQPLVAKVTDNFSNLLAGAAVSFTPPTSGASAVLNSLSATTATDGTASVDATANGEAGSYEVTAASGAATTASFALTNTDVQVVSVTRLEADPTNAASVDFLVTFNVPVSGVDESDFAPAATGTLAGAAVTGVSGSGAAYTVSVGTGTGDGTLRLDVTDDDTVVDGTYNQPLGGLGSGNGDFTTGDFYTIDKTAPETSLTAGPSGPVNTADATFTFESSEPGSTYMCSLDGALFTPCTSPVDFTGLAEGPHTFFVQATDPAGNPDLTPAQLAWTVDLTEPQTTLTGGPSGLVNTAAATFTFVSNEPGSVFECSLDGAPFSPCTSPAEYTALAEGTHTFAVQATDPAGNTDSTPAALGWTVDTLAPDTAITGGPTGLVNYNTALFTFESADLSAAFECSLDGAAFAPCTSPQSLTGLAEGAHTFAVQAVDPAGNPDPTPAEQSWTVDTLAPETTITGGLSGAVNVTSASFTFESSEPGSSFECSLDGALFAPCTSPAEYTALADGDHTFAVQATDPAGNPDLTPAERTWTVGTVGPTVMLLTTPAAETTSTDASFTFTVTPGSTILASVTCWIDAGLPADCAAGSFSAAVAEGEHTFNVLAVDIATNETAVPYTWVVDLTPPTAAMTPLDAYQNTLTFTVAWSASDAFTSVASYDVQVDAGSGWADWLAGTALTTSDYTGVEAGTYAFRVRATDAVGNVSDWSAPVSTTLDTVAPLATMGPVVTNYGVLLSMSWSATDATSGVATYTVEVQENGGAWTPWLDSTLSTTGSYLGTPGSVYAFRVRAVDLAGNTGEWSAAEEGRAYFLIFMPYVANFVPFVPAEFNP